MIITKAELEAIAVKAAQYPEDSMAEIAFAGRSNVGKSSLLNLLTGRKSLARVSQNPGKTRTINFYRINDSLKKVVQLVDIRHAPSAQDIQMYEYLRHYGLDGLVVATKADKVSRNEAQKCISVIRRTLKLSESDKVIPVSSLKKTGQDKLLDEMERLLMVEE